jgi:hypothetical protein
MASRAISASAMTQCAASQRRPTGKDPAATRRTGEQTANQRGNTTTATNATDPNIASTISAMNRRSCSPMAATVTWIASAPLIQIKTQSSHSTLHVMDAETRGRGSRG